MKNILLICPPAVSLHGPAFGLAAVAGHLRNKRPDYRIMIEDLNVRCANHILAEIPVTSELHQQLRSRWTQAEIVQDALSRWAFGDNAPAGLGSMPDWECRYLAALFSQVLDAVPTSVDVDPHLIGISVCDNSLVAAVGLSRRLKLTFPTSMLVWGGVSVSEDQAPAVLRAIPEVDAVVVGEGEDALVALADESPRLPSKGIFGILTRDTKDRVRAPRRNYLPSEPAYDLFDLSLYPALELPMTISRGCNWGKCVFCNDAYRGSRFHPGDPLRTARWALEWQRKFRPVSFELVDSAATADPSLFRRFVDALIDGGGLREWRCMMRTDQVVAEDLERAVDSGLRAVYFGLESLSDTVLKRMGKGVTVADNLRAITIALESGLKVEGDLIVFHPGETPETIRQSVQLIKSLGHLFSRVNISFSRFVPCLRSKTWTMPTKYGIRLTEYSLYLTRRLPESVAGNLVYSDRLWEYLNQHEDETVAMGSAYLEMQATISAMRDKVTVQRNWQRLGETVVLETFGHMGQALDRIFLEGVQVKVWDLLGEVCSEKEIAEKTGASSDDLKGFLTALAEKGFCYGSANRWIRVGLSGRRS